MPAGTSSTPPSEPPPMVPYSKPLRTVGFASVILAGSAGLVAVVHVLRGATCGMFNFSSAGSSCGENSGPPYLLGAVATGVVLAGFGVPLLVIGGRKVPASLKKNALVAPWVGRQSVGLSLRFAL
jgi:hypothetical protein